MTNVTVLKPVEGGARPTAEPAEETFGAIRWDYAVFFVVLHLLALLALLPWFVSWQGLIAFVVGVVVFGQLPTPSDPAEGCGLAGVTD